MRRPIGAILAQHRPSGVSSKKHYYEQHPNWQWNQHVNGWKTDQRHWRQSNGQWVPTR